MKKIAPPPLGWRNLEVEAQAELHPAWVVGSGQVHEAGASKSA